MTKVLNSNADVRYGTAQIVFTLAVLMRCSILSGYSQTIPEVEQLEEMAKENTVPEELLAARSVVLYQKVVSEKELEESQRFFQHTGIDVVAYFDRAQILAGYDSRKWYVSYCAARAIKYLIFIQKKQNKFQLFFCSFSGKYDLIDKTKAVWKQENNSLTELLQVVYRVATSRLKKQNFLINDFPEKGIVISPFVGHTHNTFSPLVRLFKTAIPRIGNEQADKELETYLKANFPVNYEFVDEQVNEELLYEKNYRTILRFVRGPSFVIKELLGYDDSTTEEQSSLTKSISPTQSKETEQGVYKFYFRNIETGDIFLGNKWDAASSWQEALRNHIQTFKENQKIN